MKKRLACVAPCILAASAYGTPNSEPPAARLLTAPTPLCVILDNPKSYAGKQLLVRGYVTRDPQRLEFRDDDCDPGFLPVTLSPETAEDRQLRSRLDTYLAQSNRKPPRVRVIYSGTFTDHSPDLICDGICSQFSLEAAKLVAVNRF